MSRYVKDIATSTDADEIQRAVSAFLTGEGFHKQQYGHEDVWAKGSGFLVARQFIKAAPVDGHVHVEAWVKAFIGGEMGTEGVMAALPKRKLKESVVHLEQLVS